MTDDPDPGVLDDPLEPEHALRHLAAEPGLLGYDQHVQLAGLLLGPLLLDVPEHPLKPGALVAEQLAGHAVVLPHVAVVERPSLAGGELPGPLDLERHGRLHVLAGRGPRPGLVRLPRVAAPAHRAHPLADCG